MSKFFKSKKQLLKAPEPRTMEEINKAYGAAAARYGNEQYKLEVQKRTVDNMFQELLALNNEGAARQKIEAETAKTETKNG